MHSDYTDFDRTPHEQRPDEEWDGVWNTEDRNRDTLRKIELGLAAIAIATALVLMRAGWVRMSSPSKRFIPSAADIHVRMPPPR
ncbi:hypothetical protein [Sphingomonas sp. Leaf38]|jgi:hypothetical protein|uniref:hypothetical protein n=1 Tax=Sphingomonas sp. Leaf38 TaxID=1736217 RepID=UPI0006F90091|nr:hypothetical protein [Sphingomonas sp. Leaf38]KQN29566.1 hypothetical protein ASE88_11755 [Sphingomonas sp. Leaf38]